MGGLENSPKHANTHTRTPTPTGSLTHTDAHTHIHTYTHTPTPTPTGSLSHTHTHTYTHTHKRTQKKECLPTLMHVCSMDSGMMLAWGAPLMGSAEKKQRKSGCADSAAISSLRSRRGIQPCSVCVYVCVCVRACVFVCEFNPSALIGLQSVRVSSTLLMCSLIQTLQ